MGMETKVEAIEDIVEVGQAQGHAVKGEDTLYVRGVLDGPADQRVLGVAVFDGHGGKAASAAALKTVGDRLMDQGPPFTDALIASPPAADWMLVATFSTWMSASDEPGST